MKILDLYAEKQALFHINHIRKYPVLRQRYS